jgi:enoyl-CoA hydratase/carnithine racemase
MSPHATRSDVDGVVTVTFTRPDKRNAVDREMFDLIAGAVADLRERDDLRVLVLTAEGDYYTGGKDVADLRTNVGQGTDGTVRGSNIRVQYRADADHDLFDAMEQVEKPVILAAQGHCLGVGVEMGVSCDFRLAAEGATFGLPEVQNLAVLPGSGGISRLTRIVGPHWARWLAMACERIDARQALAIGLVHAVYPADEFAEAVQVFARKLAGMPREALGVAKIAIDTADTVDRATARVFDRFSQTLLFSSDEFKDRVNAFNRASAARVEQRQPGGAAPGG